MAGVHVIPMNKPGWARPVWSALFVLAHAADTGAATKERFGAMLHAMAAVLPCRMCATHFEEFMAAHALAGAPSCVDYIHSVKAAVAQRESAPFQPTAQESVAHAAYMHARGARVVAQALYTMHTAARVDNVTAWSTLLSTASHLLPRASGLRDAATQYAAGDATHGTPPVRDVLLVAWRDALSAPGLTHDGARGMVAAYARDPRNLMPWKTGWKDDWFLVDTADAVQHGGKGVKRAPRSSRDKTLAALRIVAIVLAVAAVVTLGVVLFTRRRRGNRRGGGQVATARASRLPRSYRVHPATE